MVVAIARISIAMVLLRLTVQPLESLVMYTVIGLTVTICMGFWFLLILQCHPVQEFWLRTGQGHCIDTKIIVNVAYLYSASACLCDFTLGLFPIYLVKHLQMSWRTKLALATILGMGCV